MKKSKKHDNIKNEILSIGIELSVIKSLTKLIEENLYEKVYITEADLSNLLLVLKRTINSLIDKCDNIELKLDI